MCGKDRLSPSHLSLAVILLLAVCACSLAVHFVAEPQFLAAGRTWFNLDAQDRGGNLVGEHCEDHFIFPFLAPLPVEQFTISLRSPAANSAFTFSIIPLVPPPNS